MRAYDYYCLEFYLQLWPPLAGVNPVIAGRQVIVAGFKSA
jgi:hypothetical protein